MTRTTIALALFGATLATAAHAAPTIGGCPVFPANNWWNAKVDTLPVHPQSAAWIASIGATRGFHMDFGSGLYPDPPDPEAAPIGIPYVTVAGSQPKINVTFTDYGDESDAGPGVPAVESPPGSGNYIAQYPIPSNAPIEGAGPATPPDAGGDRHVLVVDTTNCILYETGNNYVPGVNGPTWTASGGAVFALNSNAMRPRTWTSADAAGFPILPGLARFEEVQAGVIEHALRFTASVTLNRFLWPATHQAGGNVEGRPPMGARFRLKASYNINGFSPQAKVIAQAMKTYGLALADNGSSWYVSGTPNPGWDNDVLHELDALRGSDFEAVDTCGLMVNPNSAQVSGTFNNDLDNDGIPNCIEADENRNALAKDNDIFGNARLFAMQQYRDFLGREGDAGGVTFWTGQMNTGAQTRTQMVQTFFDSAEFQGTVSPVARLYFAYFLRIPDYGGLNFWVGQYRGGNTLNGISDAFAGSAEFVNTYGALNNGQFVDRVYRNVLGRAPDQAGLAYWTGQIDGGMTRGQMMVQFSNSPEYANLIGSKVFVTMIYMGMLRRQPDQGGFDFWVGEKDAGNSGAGLISSFLGSLEYHNRFLP